MSAPPWGKGVVTEAAVLKGRLFPGRHGPGAQDQRICSLDEGQLELARGAEVAGRLEKEGLNVQRQSVGQEGGVPGPSRRPTHKLEGERRNVSGPGAERPAEWHRQAAAGASNVLDSAWR